MKRKLKTMWMIVTPDLAKEWLDTRNINNRSISPSKVTQYAKDMQQGNWALTHQGVAFYEDGTLADGQHRLAACVKTGIALETQISYGVVRLAGFGIDCHRARSTRDQIRISNLSDWVGTMEQAIAKLLGKLNGYAFRSMSVHEIVAFCDDNREAIEVSVSAIKSKMKNISIAPVYAAMACAQPHVGTETINRFGKVLITGVPMDLEVDVPILRLRDRLMSFNREFSNSEQARQNAIKICMRAITAVHGREKLTKLNVPAEYVYPILSFDGDNSTGLLV